MIQMQTVLEVTDNSGAKKIALYPPAWWRGVGRVAHLGDVITASVKEATPDSAIKKGIGRQGGRWCAPGRNTAVKATAPISDSTTMPP